MAACHGGLSRTQIRMQSNPRAHAHDCASAGSPRRFVCLSGFAHDWVSQSKSWNMCLRMWMHSSGNAEVRLRHCLDPRVRRWCSCEFFCSAIDRPWLMRNELMGYLTHVGIAKGTKLARPELAIIRASLGRPRRLSLGYLRQVSLSCRCKISLLLLLFLSRTYLARALILLHSQQPVRSLLLCACLKTQLSMVPKLSTSLTGFPSPRST